MRRRSRIGLRFVPVAMVLLSFGTFAGAEPDPFHTYRVLGDNGAIFEWSPGGSRLRPAASPLGSSDLAGTVNDLAAFGGGSRLVVLTSNRRDQGRGRKRREGLALIYDTSRPIPEILHHIRIEGDGYGVVAAPDGGRCYVLAARIGEVRGGPRFWIHAVDPETGEVTSSTLLERPASGLTVAPDGSRLFASFDNRIQTYTTRPLLSSWHYRSPGINGPLYFPPNAGILYALRSDGIALFDPAVILNRDHSTRHDEVDDSTGFIPLAFGPSAMLFSGEAPRAAVLGSGAVAFIDLDSGIAIPSASSPGTLKGADLLRPLRFLGDELIVGLFPDAVTTAIAAPEPPPTGRFAIAGRSAMASPPPAGVEEDLEEDHLMPNEPIGASPSGSTAVEAREPGSPEQDSPAPPAPPAIEEPAAADPAAAPRPVARPDPDPQATPEPERSAPSEPSLAGRLRGDHAVVAELVLYGPDSIIREFARIAPAADGRFRIPLPPPGTYRLLPVGRGSRPIDSEPNFHTIVVESDGDRSDLDFSIESSP